MENRQPIRPEHLVDSFGALLRVRVPTPELRDWLDQHTPGWRYFRRSVVFVSPDHAFEFRMRWA